VTGREAAKQKGQMQAAITVRQLTKTYSEGEASVIALRGVDLDGGAPNRLMRFSVEDPAEDSCNW